MLLRLSSGTPRPVQLGLLFCKRGRDLPCTAVPPSGIRSFSSADFWCLFIWRRPCIPFLLTSGGVAFLNPGYFLLNDFVVYSFRRWALPLSRATQVISFWRCSISSFFKDVLGPVKIGCRCDKRIFGNTFRDYPKKILFSFSRILQISLFSLCCNLPAFIVIPLLWCRVP